MYFPSERMIHNGYEENMKFELENFQSALNMFKKIIKRVD
jgi:hypothetical protein